jgi:hypothetical protein
MSTEGETAGGTLLTGQLLSEGVFGAVLASNRTTDGVFFVVELIARESRPRTSMLFSRTDS